MSASPSTYNYSVGKGTVQFNPTGGADTWIDLGNAPTFEFTPELETLDHFSSRSGVRNKDRSIVLEKSGTVRVVLDEWSAYNMSLALLGELSVNSAGQNEIDIFASNAIEGKLRFVGTNEVGPKWTVVFNKVSFIPDAALPFISDEWGEMELSAEVQADDDGVFGTATQTAEDEAAPSESSSA